MNLKIQLRQALLDALQSLNINHTSIQISPPKNPSFGDLSTNLALSLAKSEKKSPLIIAKDIMKNLKVDQQIISEITVTPPGFINFRIGPVYYYQRLNQILEKKSEFGKNHLGNGKSANVEFVSANPTGPLTIGHGRQAILGDTISSILAWHGYDVFREYYFNDAGRQMRLLGQSVEARYFQLLGKESDIPDGGYEGHYIKDIAKSLLKKSGPDLKKDDPLFKESGENFIFADIKSTLKKLGILHDIFTNEKTFYENGDIEKLINELKERDLVYEKDGATWFQTTKLGKEQDRVLIKSTGEPTYRLPDMAYHRNKIERNYDLIIDIFGADHIDTYPDVLAALNALEYNTDHIKVLIHQFVTLVRAGEKIKMSTRKANFVTLDTLSEEVGTDVVRYFFIMRGMNSHLNFDLDLAKDQSDQNPVFYLQYAHARISNIIKHGQESGLKFQEDYQPDLLNDDSELTLLKTLDQFPDIMVSALESLEPQLVASYLQTLATHFHKFYSICRVITTDIPLSQARLALIAATRIILASGLKILGINAPERM